MGDVINSKFQNEWNHLWKRGGVHDIVGKGKIRVHSRCLGWDCKVTRLCCGPIALSLYAKEIVNAAEKGSEFDTPEDSMAPMATLDLLSGGEGGRRGVFPHFFGVVETDLDPDASMSV